MPANRMDRFQLFIGTWNTHGDVLPTPHAAATTLIATDTYRWLPGKHFIVHEVDARFGDAPTRSMEVIGYDRGAGKFLARSYDDQGASEAFDVKLSGKRWSIVGATTRFNGRFDRDGDRLTGLWEIKSRRSVWRPWIELSLERA